MIIKTGVACLLLLVGVLAEPLLRVAVKSSDDTDLSMELNRGER